MFYALVFSVLINVYLALCVILQRRRGWAFISTKIKPTRRGKRKMAAAFPLSISPLQFAPTLLELREQGKLDPALIHKADQIDKRSQMSTEQYEEVEGRRPVAGLTLGANGMITIKHDREPKSEA